MVRRLALVGQPLEVFQRLAKGDWHGRPRIGRLDLEKATTASHTSCSTATSSASSNVLEKLRHQKRLAWKVRSFMGEVDEKQVGPYASSLAGTPSMWSGFDAKTALIETAHLVR